MKLVFLCVLALTVVMQCQSQLYERGYGEPANEDINLSQNLEDVNVDPISDGYRRVRRQLFGPFGGFGRRPFGGFGGGFRPGFGGFGRGIGPGFGRGFGRGGSSSSATATATSNSYGPGGGFFG